MKNTLYLWEDFKQNDPKFKKFIKAFQKKINQQAESGYKKFQIEWAKSEGLIIRGKVIGTYNVQSELCDGEVLFSIDLNKPVNEALQNIKLEARTYYTYNGEEKFLSNIKRVEIDKVVESAERLLHPTPQLHYKLEINEKDVHFEGGINLAPTGVFPNYSFPCFEEIKGIFKIENKNGDYTGRFQLTGQEAQKYPYVITYKLETPQKVERENYEYNWETEQDEYVGTVEVVEYLPTDNFPAREFEIEKYGVCNEYYPYIK